MRRGVPAVVVAAGVLVAGCGETATAPTTGTPLKTAPVRDLPAAKAPPQSEGELAAMQRELDRDRDRRAAAALQRRTARARAERRHRAEDHASLADGVVTAVLDAAGFEASTIAISDDGTKARIAVTRDAVCDTPATATEQLLDRRLRRALPFLNGVAISVQGSGGSIGAVRRACGPSLPAAKGERFLTRRGTGTFRSDYLDVTAKRWSIDYASDGSFLEILVLKENRRLYRAIDGVAGPSGTRTFDGVGTYRLRIAGDGRWTVRVRAGA